MAAIGGGNGSQYILNMMKKLNIKHQFQHQKGINHHLHHIHPDEIKALNYHHLIHLRLIKLGKFFYLFLKCFLFFVFYFYFFLFLIYNKITKSCIYNSDLDERHKNNPPLPPITVDDDDDDEMDGIADSDSDSTSIRENDKKYTKLQQILAELEAIVKANRDQENNRRRNSDEPSTMEGYNGSKCINTICI